MKIGFSLPNIGSIGTAEAITKVAQRAEALGYSSLWTIERLLWPLNPQRPYPGTPDGHLPEIYKQVLDPVDALTYVAAQTKKIRLGTSVLDMPYHNPVVLARRLATLDVRNLGEVLAEEGGQQDRGQAVDEDALAEFRVDALRERGDALLAGTQVEQVRDRDGLAVEDRLYVRRIGGKLRRLPLVGRSAATWFAQTCYGYSGVTLFARRL